MKLYLLLLPVTIGTICGYYLNAIVIAVHREIMLVQCARIIVEHTRTSMEKAFHWPRDNKQALNHSYFLTPESCSMTESHNEVSLWTKTMQFYIRNLQKYNQESALLDGLVDQAKS